MKKKRKRKLTKYEIALPKWQAALQRGWLADHPNKTVADYEIAGSCSDTVKGGLEYFRWVEKWEAREGRAIHARIFKGVFR